MWENPTLHSRAVQKRQQVQHAQHGDQAKVDLCDEPPFATHAWFGVGILPWKVRIVGVAEDLCLAVRMARLGIVVMIRTVYDGARKSASIQDTILRGNNCIDLAHRRLYMKGNRGKAQENHTAKAHA